MQSPLLSPKAPTASATGLLNTSLPRADAPPSFEQRRFEVKHFFRRAEQELGPG